MVDSAAAVSQSVADAAALEALNDAFSLTATSPSAAEAVTVAGEPSTSDSSSFLAQPAPIPAEKPKATADANRTLSDNASTATAVTSVTSSATAAATSDVPLAASTPKGGYKRVRVLLAGRELAGSGRDMAYLVRDNLGTPEYPVLKFHYRFAFYAFASDKGAREAIQTHNGKKDAGPFKDKEMEVKKVDCLPKRTVARPLEGREDGDGEG